MTKAITIYGIKNCDTMKKARVWLDKRGVDYVFHDCKVSGMRRKLGIAFCMTWFSGDRRWQRECERCWPKLRPNGKRLIVSCPVS